MVSPKSKDRSSRSFSNKIHYVKVRGSSERASFWLELRKMTFLPWKDLRKHDCYVEDVTANRKRRTRTTNEGERTRGRGGRKEWPATRDRTTPDTSSRNRLEEQYISSWWHCLTNKCLNCLVLLTNRFTVINRVKK